MGFFPNRYRREKDSLQEKYTEQEMKASRLEEEVQRYQWKHHTHL